MTAIASTTIRESRGADLSRRLLLRNPHPGDRDPYASISNSTLSSIFVGLSMCNVASKCLADFELVSGCIVDNHIPVNSSLTTMTLTESTVALACDTGICRMNRFLFLFLF
jgi:hypothetical protein